MKKILLAISLIFSLSQAGSFHKDHNSNRVIVNKIYTYQNNAHYRNNQTAGALIGGVVGGILGHQLGGGSGKVVATVGGAIIGTVVGSNLSYRGDERRVVHYAPRHQVERIVYYTPHHKWERVAYINRHRFHNERRVIIYRDYR